MKVFVVMNCYEYGEVGTWAAYSSEADAHAEATRAEAEDRRTVRDVYEVIRARYRQRRRQRSPLRLDKWLNT